MVRDGTGGVDELTRVRIDARRAVGLWAACALAASASSTSACTRLERWPLEIPPQLLDGATRTLVLAAFRDRRLEALGVHEPSDGPSPSDDLLPQLVDDDDSTLTVTLVGYGARARALNLPVGNLLASPLERKRPLPPSSLVFTAAVAPGTTPTARSWRGGDASMLADVTVPELPPLCPAASRNEATDLDLRVAEPLEDGELFVGVRDVRTRRISFGPFTPDGALLRVAEGIGGREDGGADVRDVLHRAKLIHATTNAFLLRVRPGGEVVWSRPMAGARHLAATADGSRWYAATRAEVFTWTATSSATEAIAAPVTDPPGQIEGLTLLGDRLYVLVASCARDCSTDPTRRDTLFAREGDTWMPITELPDAGRDLEVDEDGLVILGRSLLMTFRPGDGSVGSSPLPNAFTVGVTRLEAERLLVISPGRYAIQGNGGSFAVTSGDISRAWCLPLTGTTRDFDDLALDPVTGELILVDDRDLMDPSSDDGFLGRIPTR